MSDQTEQAIPGTATEEEGTEQQATAIPPVPAVPSTPPGRTEMVPAAPAPSLAVAPRVGADDLVKRLEVIRQAMNQAMDEDVDYGVIPGTNTKPTLLKPGAEKLGVLFELDIQLTNEKLWDPPHLTVVSRAAVYHAPTGTRLGYGEGICTTHEKKYAKRQAQRKCPECQQETIFRSKYSMRGEPDDAPPCWFCWASKGGCGKEFAQNDPKITDQDVGEIENPNLPDTWNTIVKMAEKRARVDAVLAVTGASALFTQDVEDLPPEDRVQDGDRKAETKPRGQAESSGGGSKGKPMTGPQKGKITKLLNAKIPKGPETETAPGGEYHEAVKASVRDGSSKDASSLIGALEMLDATDQRNVKTFLDRYGVDYTLPAGGVPADTSDLDASDQEEAKAIAEAQGEGADAVEQSLLGSQHDED